MPKIAYIMLCHKDPQAVIEQARLLTAAGDYVAIHFDKRAPKSDYDKLCAELQNDPQITFARKRIKCGWGEWSLVKATLYTIEAALEKFQRATHFYMISGDCAPIKSARYAHEFLENEDVDYIESFDFFESNWIKTGIKEERLIYRHFFNERTQSKLFYASFHLQQKLGLTRKIPADIEIQIGSQWWCLRRQTVEAIQAFIRARPDVVRFFKTTWIPDETFFQTLVRHLVPSGEIRSRTLTFLMFTDYGLPVVFYNDHFDILLAQDYLFARKISPEAKGLRNSLGKLYADDTREFHVSGGGDKLFRFITSRGRHGRRFGARFWEERTSLGRRRELYIVVCKKWHVAKRLMDRFSKITDMPMLGYIFSEEDAGLPNLGGIEKTLRKRARHRRAVVRMLCDFYQTDRLLLCVDPADFDTLMDFASDQARTRILEVACEFSPTYVLGHAKRTGLVTQWTPEHVLERLLPTVRKELYYEGDRIKDAAFANHWIMSETYSDNFNASQLSRFIELSTSEALELARMPYLFSD